MESLALIALMGVIMASIIVPTTIIAVIKTVPSNGQTKQ